MTYIHTSRPYFRLLFLILYLQRCSSAAALSVQCEIINFDYVECIWQRNASTMNYTFSSMFTNHGPYEDCPEYIIKQNHAGCRIPLKNHGLKFNQFNVTIYTEGKHTISKTFDSLIKNVQLHPPYNLSVVWNEHNDTLLLHWNSSALLNEKCIVYMVQNLEDPSQSFNVTETSYSLSPVSQNKLYVFQVRSKVADSCGSSDVWSDWSAPVKWRGTGNSSRPGWLYAILSVVLLSMLGLLLWYCERKKIIFLPVVPDPSINLQDLFHKHDGNVESWIHISKELKEAFQPDYTEPSCDVCEVSPSRDSISKPTVCPDPEACPKPTACPDPEACPKAEACPEHEACPKPKACSEPEACPERKASPEAEAGPEPEDGPEPEACPEPEASPEPEACLAPQTDSFDKENTEEPQSS